MLRYFVYEVAFLDTFNMIIGLLQLQTGLRFTHYWQCYGYYMDMVSKGLRLSLMRWNKIVARWFSCPRNHYDCVFRLRVIFSLIIKFRAHLGRMMLLRTWHWSIVYCYRGKHLFLVFVWFFIILTRILN